MEFKIGLAGRIIGVKSMYDEIYEMCRDYLAEGAVDDLSDGAKGFPAEGAVDFKVEVSQADINFEREKSVREAMIEGIPPQDYPDEYLETLAVYRKIAVGMLQYDTLLMHGAVVGIKNGVADSAENLSRGIEGDERDTLQDAEGKAVLFTAQSGVGKTTHLRLWLDQIPGSFVVNGDKPLLRFQNGKWDACGTPWAGKEGMQTNVTMPLAAICFLERGNQNTIERVSFMEYYPLLFQQVYRSSEPEYMTKTMELLMKIGENMPLYRLRCTMDKEAAWVAYEGIFGKNKGQNE
jgi:hypothetical protein